MSYDLHLFNNTRNQIENQVALISQRRQAAVEIVNQFKLFATDLAPVGKYRIESLPLSPTTGFFQKVIERHHHIRSAAWYLDFVRFSPVMADEQTTTGLLVFWLEGSTSEPSELRSFWCGFEGGGRTLKSHTFSAWASDLVGEAVAAVHGIHHVSPL